MPLSQTVLLSLLVGTVGVISLSPGLITSRTLDLVYFLDVLLLIAFMVAGAVDAEGLDAASYGLQISVSWAALCLCFLDLNPRVNAVGMLLVGAAWAATAPLEIAVLQWASLGPSFALICWMDHVLTDSMRAEIFAKDSRGELAAVKTLLETICESVVELDSTLRLRQHSASLSDILLHASGRSLQGSSMQDFMPEQQDRRQFEERLGGADRAAAHAEVFHATLCDSIGTRISMEFFSVAFAGPDTRRHHLLGMREFTDILPMTLQSQPPRAARRTHGRRSAAAAAERGGAARSARTPEVSSEAESSSSRPAAAAQSPGPRRETGRLAKTYTLTDVLMRWHVSPPEGSCCCSFHATVASARGIIEAMVTSKCNHAFGPTSEWQCPKCGIVMEGLRDRAGEGEDRCLLCEIMESDVRNGPRSTHDSDRAATL